MGKKSVSISDKKTSVAAFLAAETAGLSRANADRLVKSGEVKVNGVRVRSNVEIDVGDEIAAFVPDSLLAAVDLPIIYEDSEVVIFDKPKRLSFDKIPKLYGSELYAVHRLDTNTSGLIVFAKTDRARIELESAFRDRRVKKVYEAVVCPVPQEEKAVLTAYHTMKNGIACVSAVPRSGYKTMVTEYNVSERMGNAALIRVMPHTGRTHQIRAHMKYIGSPIVGDPKYGGCHIDGAPDTQMLAATELAFYGMTELRAFDGRSFQTKNGFDLSFLKR